MRTLCWFIDILQHIPYYDANLKVCGLVRENPFGDVNILLKMHRCNAPATWNAEMKIEFSLMGNCNDDVWYNTIED